MKLKTYPEYKDSGVEWIGEIPSNWEISRIKNHVESFKSGEWGGEKKNDKNDVVCIRVADFDYPKGTIYNEEYTIRNISSNKGDLILKKGDLLIEKSGGGEKQPVGRLVIFNKEFKAVCSNFVSKIKIKNEDNSKYFYYLFSVLYSSKINIKSIKQTTGIQNLNMYSYFMERIANPKLFEQKQIVSYLDKKTFQIDKIIGKDTKLVELLKEKRTALINHVVTKGLDPDAKMKDSGVEWIGEIPEGWEVVPLTKFLESKVDYRGKTPQKTDEGIFLVTAKNIKEGKINYELSQEYVSEDQYNEIMHRGKPKKGDLLFTTEAPLGEVANVVNSKIALAQRIIKMRGKIDILNNYFLKYYTLSYTFQGHLQSLATGSTALGIKASKLFMLRLILPTYDEQLKIVDYLNNLTSKIDKTIQKIERKIELLGEYKRSLIHHVITGKVDVRDEVVV